MTDPLLWLDGDPTDGRRARPHEFQSPPAAASPPPVEPAAPRRSGHFRSALAGGLVSALLVGGGAFAFGVLDTGNPTVPATPALVGAKQTGDVAAIYAAARESVVSIKTKEGSGSGFVVDNGGTIVTNAHVVGTASTVQVQLRRRRPAGRPAQVGRRRPLVRPRGRQDRPDRAHAQAALARRLRQGQVGDSWRSPSATRSASTARDHGRHRLRHSAATIQAPNGFQIDKVIQTDAPINPGNSGGPLLDASGRVIGVNSQIATAGGGGNVGIGFAVPSNTVREVVPRLERGETIKRAYLGVSTSGGDAAASPSPRSPPAPRPRRPA